MAIAGGFAREIDVWKTGSRISPMSLRKYDTFPAIRDPLADSGEAFEEYGIYAVVRDDISGLDMRHALAFNCTVRFYHRKL